MREEVNIDGLNIAYAKIITGIRVVNPRAIEVIDSGVSWNGRVILLAGGKELFNQDITEALRRSSFASIDALNSMSQIEYSKEYIELTVPEAQLIQGKTLGNNIAINISNIDSGLSSEAITELVTTIITAIV